MYYYTKSSVRLACIKHAASVHPEPGSNSPHNFFIHLRRWFMSFTEYYKRLTWGCRTFYHYSVVKVLSSSRLRDKKPRCSVSFSPASSSHFLVISHTLRRHWLSLKLVYYTDSSCTVKGFPHQFSTSALAPSPREPLSYHRFRHRQGILGISPPNSK